MLLLNNDTQLMPGALDRLVRGNSTRNWDVAAVGPKMLYPNGRLQEAGCTVNADGITEMIGLFGDPAKPAFSYDRDVHYCSGAALLVRRTELGESLFDEDFYPRVLRGYGSLLEICCLKGAVSFIAIALRWSII